ncbi:unnamed protein product [Scytosiphon promiscuus]
MRPTISVLLVANCALLRFLWTYGQPPSVGPSEVCAEFAASRHPVSGWTLDDCTDVWARFEDSARRSRRHSEVDLWKDTAVELRQLGSPCLLGSVPGADGVGSTAIRHVATWIFAEEMGCDWLAPDWSKNKRTDTDGTVVYCHAIVPLEERRSPTNTSGVPGMARCTVVNWLSYFQFDKSSVSWPSGGSVKLISQLPEKGSIVAGIKGAKEDLELERIASKDRGWEHVVFQVGMTAGSRSMVNPGSWSARKLSITRKVLGQMREQFHRHPRQWYDGNPRCLFDPSRLHFAVHVRMGDRHRFADKHPEYVNLLEDVMSTISHEVTQKGLLEPLFHVFSETVNPCPSEKTGVFGEFPAWPVTADQVAACRAAAEHDGIFRVRDKAIMLHFDRDVRNTLSCMIQADGIVMGCSTFGQVAGLFSKGISMFSMHCEGERTPLQYKMIPPLALSERGQLWVPIVGSWYDPVLNATHIFRNVLDTLLQTTSKSFNRAA